jgi:orotidine-5'-phosphate decarboxylase
MKPELIVALDVDTIEKAEQLVTTLSPAVKYFKIGSQLFTAYGPAAVRMAVKKGGRVFLDLKFHDIPNTVRNAAAAGTSAGVFMMTVHSSGGAEMLRSAGTGVGERAKELGISRPAIIGVTVLTSGSAEANTREGVLRMARTVYDAGLDGIVCAVSETEAVRKEFGPDFVIVNPGIRPAGAQKGDQKRIATPADAVKAGASYIVVGRPILEAADPRKAAEDILKEIKGA